MKFYQTLAALLVVAASAKTLREDPPEKTDDTPEKTDDAPKKEAGESPMARVVKLLAGLKVEIAADGKAEQATYDKFACWCEDTLTKKAAEISAGKKAIEDLTNLIVKTKADLSSHTAEIAQLKKQIAQNIDSQREATEVREKEAAEYKEERAESENCIGALEAAIKVLAGAGAGKKSFLGTLQEAQLLGVVAGIKGVLKTSEVHRRFSDDEIAAVAKFAAKPEDYVGSRSNQFSAAQVAQNPFGDYAPQSTQIQGILKGMYDSFTADLEKDNAEEADKQKAHEALMATKKAELATLEATLEKQELDAAEATKTLADSKETLDNTKETLAADEAFFSESKSSCQTKAAQWAERTRLRTEELHGMDQAITILSGGEETFKSATTTFLQVASRNSLEDNNNRAKAYARMKELAEHDKNRLGLAKIAVAIKTQGHFDKILTMIDKMIFMLRIEEQEDIAHRDRCENAENANKNSQDDLQSDITKSEEYIQRMNNQKDELNTNKGEIEGQISETKKAMDDLLTMRNKEEADFKQALKDDAEAVRLLGEAIATLSKFYTDNKIEFVQKKVSQDPPAPETWSGSYGGKKGQTNGIIAILSMLKDDLEGEMKVGKADDVKAQANYEKDSAALQETLDSQERVRVAIEGALADLVQKIEGESEEKGNSEADMAAGEDIKKSLYTDCAWTETNFKSRRDKRKLEMDGLVEAKNFLAGVDAGDAELPPDALQ